VASQGWPEEGSEQAAEVKPYKPLNEKADTPVEQLAYKMEVGFDKGVTSTMTLRPDPVLLNVVEVRGMGGGGQFAFADEAVRKQRELRRAREMEEKAKKDEEKAAKDAKEGKEGGGGGEAGAGRRPPRGGEGPGEPGSMLFDPDHPKRKPVDGALALGVMRQGDERVEQASWAIITAKVPIREQLKLYQDAFEKARGGYDPTRDFPRYQGFLVQRAEVLPGKEITEADWKPVPVYDGQKKSIIAKTPLNAAGAFGDKVLQDLMLKMAEWAGQSMEVVDPRYTDPLLTFPLPPLVGRNWGSDAKHPDFPILAETPLMEEEAPPVPVTPTTPAGEPKDKDESDAFASGQPGTGPLAGGGFPGGGGRFGPEGGMGRGGMFGGGGRGGFEGGMGGGMGRGGMFGGGGRGGFEGGEGGPRPGGGGFGGGMSGANRVSLPKGLDYLMLRFFDFTVEPGKSYKYRVQVVLADANYSIDKNMLAPEVRDRISKEIAAANARKTTRRDMRRVEKWSDPSPTVGIPLAGTVKLVEAKPSSAEKINDEPMAKLLVESFDIDDAGNAIQAAIKKEFRRGAVANLVEDARYLGQGWTDEKKGAKFVTGMTVLDIEGGKGLAKDYKSPARLLLMGPAGELYIRNELDDKPDIDTYNMIFEQEPMHTRGGFEGGGEGGFGPRGRPGGGIRGGGRD
jgi:hypothetical protein